MPATIFVYLLGLIGVVADGEPVRIAFAWIPSLGLDLSFFIDGLALTFALTISGVGTFILIYAGSYLKGHPHLGRFLAYLLAFMGAMLGLVLADNMLALFGFWELTSITSFLLISFDHRRQAARRAAIQALVITNLGGLALLLGAIATQRLLGHWDLSAIRAAGGTLGESSVYLLVLWLFLAAAFSKSAQFPLHFWLPNAMEAPTPVSAFLHSATMVQAGVYLLARMTPILGETPAWTGILCTVGGVTLLWGAFAALRQTDIKLMLAQTTIASLGLLVFLIGIGSETALIAMVVYFIAHAAYKAALFMIAGIIDHETGTRDLTALGGLRDKLPLTFIATILAAISMIGLPPTLGYFSKEEMYLALFGGQWQGILGLAVLILGNALLAAAALIIAIRPFMGRLGVTPKTPHEAPLAMVVGPLALGVGAVLFGFFTPWFDEMVLSPTSSAIAGMAIAAHLHTGIDPLNPILWLSLLTWALGGLAYWKWDQLRTGLRRAAAAPGLSFDHGFDVFMFGLIRMAGALTRLWHHGRLELYMLVIFVLLALALILPVLGLSGLPAWPELPALHFHEAVVVVLALAGLVSVLFARTRLFAILALGAQGLAVALIFMLFGAPDLSFTQLMVEILSVVILALVMTRLNLDVRDSRSLEEAIRDGAVALLCGVGFVMVLLVVLGQPFNGRLSEFFTRYSTEIAHGRNIVNVILVDFRGLDTLGEMSVIMVAGIAILALLRSQVRKPLDPTPVRRRSPRKSAAKSVAGDVAPKAKAAPKARAGAQTPRRRTRKAGPETGGAGA
nr:hydrogen gas-evolving membrane-bound hydrogenase subunit E [Arsenicitalea aurantiaca]